MSFFFRDLKNHPVVVIALCCVLSACDRGDTSSTSNGASFKAQQDTYDRQAKRADEQLQNEDQLLKRGDTIVAGQEQLLKRQQEDCARFEKVLDTWESQQKQYQKYLDSLTK